MPNPNKELWSLVAVCNRCGGRIVIFTNLPERLSRIEGRYLVTCTSCNNHDLFPIDRQRADTLEIDELQHVVSSEADQKNEPRSHTKEHQKVW